MSEPQVTEWLSKGGPSAIQNSCPNLVIDLRDGSRPFVSCADSVE